MFDPCLPLSKRFELLLLQSVSLNDILNGIHLTSIMSWKRDRDCANHNYMLLYYINYSLESDNVLFHLQ